MSTTVVDLQAATILHSACSHITCNMTLQLLPSRNGVCFSSSWVLTDCNFFWLREVTVWQSEPGLSEALSYSIFSLSTLSSSHVPKCSLWNLMEDNCTIPDVVLGQSIATDPRRERTSYQTHRWQQTRKWAQPKPNKAPSSCVDMWAIINTYWFNPLSLSVIWVLLSTIDWYSHQENSKINTLKMQWLCRCLKILLSFLGLPKKWGFVHPDLLSSSQNYSGSVLTLG